MVLAIDKELHTLLGRASKVPTSASRVALQVHGVRLRLWADDDGEAIRPWYVVILELYPRGKVVNQYMARPPGRKPDASELLRVLLRHIVDPPNGEPQVRPTHVSFVDEEVANALKPRLHGIKVERLSLADGVNEYVAKFSERLVQADKGTRADNAELTGILASAEPSDVDEMMKNSQAMWDRKPWSGINDTLAIKATLPDDDGKMQVVYVSVLGGSKDSVKGFAIMPTLQALRTKFRRHQMKSAGLLDLESMKKDTDTAVIVDSVVCAACGRRVAQTSDSGICQPVNENKMNGILKANGETPNGTSKTENEKNQVWALRCAGCRRVYYCDEECQRTDWKRRHHEECNKASTDLEFTFNRPEWAWMVRELALLYVDPTAIPFDDLDAFEQNQWDHVPGSKESPPLYPFAFVSVIRPDSLQPRLERPIAREVRAVSAVASALSECVAAPPRDTVLHLASGVSLRVAEDLRVTCAPDTEGTQGA